MSSSARTYPPLSPNYDTKCEFCQYLFNAGGETVESRTAFLNGLSAVAMKSLTGGKMLISTGSAGTTAQFELFAGWDPQLVLALTRPARAWAKATDVTAALAMIVGPIRSTRPDFTTFQR